MRRCLPIGTLAANLPEASARPERGNCQNPIPQVKWTEGSPQGFAMIPRDLEQCPARCMFPAGPATPAAIYSHRLRDRNLPRPSHKSNMVSIVATQSWHPLWVISGLEPVSNSLASYVGSYPDSGRTIAGRMIEAGNASAECGGWSLRRWQRHLVRDEGVAASNPATPTRT